MKWFYDLKISRKLILAFLLSLSITVFLGSFAIIQLEKVNQAATRIATDWLPSIRSLNDMKSAISRIRANEALFILYDNDAESQRLIWQLTEKNIAGLLSTRTQYESLISEVKEKNLYPKVKDEMNRFLSDHNKIISEVNSRQNDEARTLLLGPALDNYRSMLTDLDDLAKVNSDGSNASTTEAHIIYADARIWTITLSLAAIMVGLILAFGIARIISAPLVTAVAFAKDIASGDLSGNIKASAKDETGQLMTALKTMNDSLQNIVGQIRAGTDTIATASNQISVGNTDLSSRTEEQASSLEETASAMEELTSTVRQNAASARQASQLAQAAAAIATDGGNVVSQVIQTMGAINESSRKIVDIISVIDSIAFQTNILALNAAVEAARAGEQGRGFAVVATEVRSLAQRSASAAKEIKTLIDHSVVQVGAGSELVQQAGVTMGEVVGSIRRVTAVVAEISAASDEQSSGIEQVSRAVTQMDEVTQQNAALVEEATAAAQSLTDQANDLKHLVGIFKLADGAEMMATIAPIAVSRQAVAIERVAASRPGLVLHQQKDSPPARMSLQKTETSWDTF